MIENGYELDITDNRFHHEIYLSDPRRFIFIVKAIAYKRPIVCLYSPFSSLGFPFL